MNPSTTIRNVYAADVSARYDEDKCQERRADYFENHSQEFVQVRLITTSSLRTQQSHYGISVVGNYQISTSIAPEQERHCQGG